MNQANLVTEQANNTMVMAQAAAMNAQGLVADAQAETERVTQEKALVEEALGVKEQQVAELEAKNKQTQMIAIAVGALAALMMLTKKR